MIVAVTGGSGFVGRYLVKKLLSQGSRVRVFTRDKSKFLLNISRLEVIECDLLNVTSQELIPLLEGVEILFHCVGQLNNEKLMRSLHVDATKKLSNAASKSA
mgnify:FL=1